MVFNLKRIILLVLFALYFAAAHPFNIFKSRVHNDRRAPILLDARAAPTEGAVAQDLVVPTTTFVLAAATPIYPTPLVVKEVSKNVIPPIGAVAIVNHKFAPINVSEIEAAAVIIPAVGIAANAHNPNPLFPFIGEKKKHKHHHKSKTESESSSTSTSESSSTSTSESSSTSTSQPQSDNNTNNVNSNANSSVLQAAIGIGVGLAGVAASAIGAYYYIRGRKKKDDGDSRDVKNGKDGKDDDQSKEKISITHHGPSESFVDPDNDNNTTKPSAREPNSDTIFGSQAASTSMVDLGQDTGQGNVGSTEMARHHSD
ncbi:hypothetical protein C2G38_2038979 [Gigaspora rosea]|uniref:Mid2 domain-containing protein n=1 Tax=Gigaspora rosea TaxID=44941 RepID=A0A397V1Y6_9GLOM|nr:hypothetical protein C2G38_2038979 [Gigaspora rosea]